MLAWFKKKFGIQREETPSAVEAEQGEQKEALSRDVPELSEKTPDEPAETAVSNETAMPPVAESGILREQAAETLAASEAPATETPSAAVPDTAAEDPPFPAPKAPPAADAAPHGDLKPRQESTSLPEEAPAVALSPAAGESHSHDKAEDESPAAEEKPLIPEEPPAAEPPLAAAEDHGHDETEDGILAEEENDDEAQRPVSDFTQDKPAAKSMFRRLQERLGKTRSSFVYQLDRLFLGEKEIGQELFDQLEELLITADLGVSTTMALLDAARKRVKRDQLSDPQALKAVLKEEMLAYITASDQPAELVMPETGPFVIMVVGVNGVGKTTTIGKIAAKFVRSGQSVLLIAGDTFRAAAIDQLKIWGKRVGVEVVAQKPGADPASVVFDGMEYGLAHNVDVILIDTAGRLHTSVNLMEELRKIRRVIDRRLPGAPHEVLQVLDATTGQNGIAQAKLFHEAVAVSGLALTKLDGTAKGGIVANICRELKIPVRFIGIGEQLDDLRDFDAAEFIDALFGEKSH